MYRGKWLLLVSVLLFAIVTPASTASGDSPVRAQAVFTVNDSGDAGDWLPGDGTCAAGPIDSCTLRAAVEEANLDGEPSTINFQGPMTITLASPLVLAENDTTIDGSGVWWAGAWPDGQPGVEITGALSTLLRIEGSGSRVSGLKFSSSAIAIVIVGRHYNVIGGALAKQRNVFLTSVGVLTQLAGSSHPSNNAIIGNYFGTADGTGLLTPGLTWGIVLADSNHTTIQDNLIVGYTTASWLGDAAGVLLLGADDNTFTNNTIGLSSTGLPLGNTDGVRLMGGLRNIIGQGNVIAGNTRDGIVLDGLSGAPAELTTIQSAVIGSTAMAVGNQRHGLNIVSGLKTSITNCEIARNGGDGVHVSSGPETVVTGSTINANSGDGIYVAAGVDSVLGGASDPARNTIGGNDGDGVHVGGSGITVLGNFVGLTFSGAANANKSFGILVEGADNTIGGTATGAGNVICYNYLDGIRLQGAAAKNNTVAGNRVGQHPYTGSAAANGNHGIGLYDGANNNNIGTTTLVGNTVVASGWSGIVMVNGSNNYVAANTVAYNGTAAVSPGVHVFGATATGNRIAVNSIHDNSGDGIQLESGGNANLAAPVITSAACFGPVSGTACAGCVVEIDSDNADEGRYPHTSVIADAGGVFYWAGPVRGPNVTAIASDGAQNSSAFSAPFTAGACSRLCVPLILR